MAKSKQAAFTAVKTVLLWESRDRDSLLHPNIIGQETDLDKKKDIS